jgi:hypothetical protein
MKKCEFDLIEGSEIEKREFELERRVSLFYSVYSKF